MPKLEVFFDYACPYCKLGHEYLVNIIKDFPGTEIDWKPCEAHPRPEPGPHSDIVIQGMFYALEHGVDIWKFHERMYDACLKDKINKEDVDTIAEYARDLLDAEDFKRVVGGKKYEKIQRDGNDYAYEKQGVWAVPSYRMSGKKLDAVEGVGISERQLRAFLS
ncbi:MAG: DsbA family protein [Clostridiales bacterium]|jgi:predicted DsbA family dithiol-disulfide isomerase|nr:DsbA family protein [Clostridiales bacterium]